VSPLRLAGLGGAAILTLIGIGLHPPQGRTELPASPPVWAAAEASSPAIAVTTEPDVSVEPSGDPLPTSTSPRPRRTGTPRPTATGGTRKTGAPSAPATSRSASGSKGGSGGSAASDPDEPAVPTVRCPSVAARLPAVPDGAAAEVAQNLDLLKQQIAAADARLAELAQNPVDDPNFVQNTVLGPLRDNRFATIDRIAIAISRYAPRPTGLETLAPCTLNG
jgi:hypothetical protein